MYYDKKLNQSILDTIEVLDTVISNIEIYIASNNSIGATINCKKYTLLAQYIIEHKDEIIKYIDDNTKEDDTLITHANIELD